MQVFLSFHYCALVCTAAIVSEAQTSGWPRLLQALASACRLAAVCVNLRLPRLRHCTHLHRATIRLAFAAPPSCFAGLNTTYDDHVIILGDAAGFIDPLTGGWVGG